MKQSNPGADGKCNLAYEAKVKAVLNGNTHEGTLKNNGEVIYDLKATETAKVILIS